MDSKGLALFSAGVLSVAGLIYVLNRYAHARNASSGNSNTPNAINNINDESLLISTNILSPKISETDNLIQLLFAVAEEQARKEGFVHRGITCNNCGISPIKGYRFKCANCIDFDVCENCEVDVESFHFKNHVFIKIKIPIPPLANPRAALLNVFYPGKLEGVHDLSWETVKQLQAISHFDQVEIQALFEQFKSLSVNVSDDGRGGIDQMTFEQCLGPLGVERNLITERIFRFFDQDNDGVIDFPELVTGLSILCKGSLEEKILYSFKGYDLDNDGYISRDELRKMFKAYFYLSMELVRDVVRSLEEEIIEHFNEEDSKPVSAAFTAPIPLSNAPVFRAEDEENSGVMEKMSQDAIEEMVDKTFAVIDSNSDGFISYEDFREFVKKDSTLIAWFEALGSVF